MVEGKDVEKVLLLIEEHRAVNTSARTYFSFNPPPLSERVFVGGGTHRKYLLTVRKGTVVNFTRASNRGNLHTKVFTVDKPMYIDFLGSVFPLESKYFDFAKESKLL